LYTQFAAAIAANASHRPMIFNVANLWMPQQLDGTNPAFADSAFADYLCAPAISQSWRTDTDIAFPLDFHFSNVLRNMDADAAHPEAAGPGRWNDPDALGPQIGLTADQAQAQMSMWAILAAPLIRRIRPAHAVTTDARHAREPEGARRRPGRAGKASHAADRARLRPGLGTHAGRWRGRGRVAQPRPQSAVDVHHGRGGRASRRRRLPPADLWTGQITTSTNASISATVPPTAAALYRVSYTPAPPKPKRPQTAPGPPRVKATRTGAVVTIPAAPRGDTIRVYRLIAGKRVLVFSGSKNVVRLTGLKPGRRYTFAVVYANQAGQSPSRVFVVKTLR
jgi:alpha-galactosidase